MKANIDQASCGNGVIYIVGWGFIEQGNDEKTKLILEGGLDKNRVEIPLQRVYRSDVNEHYGLEEAREVGFSIQQPFSSINVNDMPAGEYDIIVQCCDYDGKTIEVRIRKIVISWPEDISPIASDSAVITGNNKSHNQSANTLISNIKKIWYGHVGLEESELQKHLYASKVTAKGLLSVNAASDHLWPAVAYAKVTITTIVELLRQASQNEGLVVIFDHNFGGGANLFSSRMVEQNKKTHNVVLRVWYEPATTMVMGNVSYLDSDYSIEVGGLNELFSMLTAFKSAVTHINNLYAWPHIERVLDNIVRMRVYGLTERVEYYAHDHIAICPSLFLMNEKDEYCGVPDSAAVCADCLCKSEGLFRVFYQQTDVAKWRATWCSLLLNSDYIRFFSKATLREYRKAFPELENNKCVVVDPHDVDISFSEKYAVKNNDNVIRLGVFGFIDKHKGSAVVLDLVEAIKVRNEPMEIHVFGSLNGISSGSDDILKLHGSYKRENIVKILNENEINIALMPSICPETFSFVTAELLNANVDVIAFDVGAQADLTKSRSNGFVVPLFSDVPLIDHVVEVMRNKSDD